MLRSLRVFSFQKKVYSSMITKHNFLNNAYNCPEAWNSRDTSIGSNKINLNDFYNILDQSYSSKGVISAIDVDIFANSVQDSSFLDELKDLLYKLRLSAETVNTLDSTHHTTVRNYINFGNIDDLIEILKQPLDYGLFLDEYTANMLLNKLITSLNFQQAAAVASLVMLQEDYSNEITCALCQYACYKFLINYIPPEPEPITKTNKKVEEIKIRVKFLRNPYHDDHFDITDPLLLSGKTLAWISEKQSNNLNLNLQIIGWLYFKKYETLLSLCENVSKNASFKLYKEVKDLLVEESKKEPIEPENIAIFEKCIFILNNVQLADISLEESLKVSIENAINKVQQRDIAAQKQLFKSWAEIREAKLNEQISRLDRAKRIQNIEEKQNKLKEEEQKLWFFENEDKIDLEIEAKEKLEDHTTLNKRASKKTDDNYIPPEIIPKRR